MKRVLLQASRSTGCHVPSCYRRVRAFRPCELRPARRPSPLRNRRQERHRQNRQSKSPRQNRKQAERLPAPPRDATLEVIAAGGSPIEVKRVGITMFGNEQTELPSDAWGIDDLVFARIRAAAGGNVAVRRIAYASGAFNSYNQPAKRTIADAKENFTAIVRQVAANSRCARYIVVVRTVGSLSGTNQSLTGVGVYTHGPFGKAAVYDFCPHRHIRRTNLCDREDLVEISGRDCLNPCLASPRTTPFAKRLVLSFRLPRRARRETRNCVRRPVPCSPRNSTISCLNISRNESYRCRHAKDKDLA